MKFIKKLFEWVLLLLIGFSVGLLVGTEFESPAEILKEDEPTEVMEDPTSSEHSSPLEIPFFDLPSRESDDINYEQIEKDIITYVNVLRVDLGLNPVQPNDVLKGAATIRAIETEELFAHTRPDGRDPFTVFEEEGLNYNYKMVGENLAMVTYHRDDEHMAKFIFDGWVDSKGHYETMIQPDFEEIGVGIHYDGEILYATQFFGTQR